MEMTAGVLTALSCVCETEIKTVFHCVNVLRVCRVTEESECSVLLFQGVNLLVGTESGLMLLDRSGQGKVYPLISRRRFQQMDVLEGLNVLVTISGEKALYVIIADTHTESSLCYTTSVLVLFNLRARVCLYFCLSVCCKSCS